MSHMARTQSLSGFPELLPEERLIELHLIDSLRRTFELHGFSSIETRSVETLDQLLRKGDIDKEVYAVGRLQALLGDQGSNGTPDAASAKIDPKKQMALHFDLTVPFSRYVTDNAGHLTFPFRRFQIQKAWRGERPQEGREREFLQADIDIIGEGTLPFIHDVELALIVLEAFGKLPLPPVKLRVNNRKLAQGYYEGIGLADSEGVLRVIDKLEKIGPEKVKEALETELGASAEQADAALALASIETEDTSFVDKVRALGVTNEKLEEGLAELEQVIAAAVQAAPGKVVADLSIARGLDYYTGTVYETQLVGHEELGSVCSGGRYESLARKGNRTFPGVGLSIGVSRIMARVLAQNLAKASRSVPTAVYVALANDEQWGQAQDIAAQLRARDIAVEVGATASKFGKQIKYADNRGIPFVWFIGEDGTSEVKDIRSGEQVSADPATWEPPQADRTPRITS